MCTSVCVCACVRGLLLVFQTGPSLRTPPSQSQLCINYKRRDATSSPNSPLASFQRREEQGGGVGKPIHVNRGARAGVAGGGGEPREERKLRGILTNGWETKEGLSAPRKTKLSPLPLLSPPPQKNFSITKRIPPSCFHYPTRHLAPPPEGTPLDL